MALKDMRLSAEKLLEGGITTKAALVEALPVLVKLQSAAAKWVETLAECKGLAKALSEACGKYALEHQSVFDDGLQESAIGVKGGDITVDDVTYHFTNGYDTPKRSDGGKISQSFLAGLPEGWVKSSLKLDTTGINRAGVSDETLAEKGLHRPDTFEWSV